MANKLRVTLTYSENQYLSYPCTGLLELFELGSDGSVIVGVFQRDGESRETGYRHAPVRVSRPVFNYPGEQVRDDRHPMQPIVFAEKGVIRFKENRIVSHLLDFATPLGCGMNELAKP